MDCRVVWQLGLVPAVPLDGALGDDDVAKSE
jgi:hypothetical protein